MRTYTVLYESVLSYHFLQTDEIKHAKSILIQIYSTYHSQKMLEKIAREALIFFPDAIIVGVSTSGTIYYDTFSSQKTIVTITTFEHTTISATAISLENDETLIMYTGEKMAKEVLRHDTKALLLLADSLYISPDSLLEGINKVAPNTPVFGVLAADGEKFFKTTLLLNGDSYTSGAVLLSLNGSRLSIHTQTHLPSYEIVGPDIEVTSSIGPIVKYMNHQTPMAFFKRYLGSAFTDKLPAASFEIALVSTENETRTVRHILGIEQDGACRFAGSLPVKSRWRFSYGRKEMPFTFSLPLMPDNRLPEAYWLFCDMATSKYLAHILHRTIEQLSKRGDVIGAIGYGEIDSGKIHNQAIVIVGLSEAKQSPKENQNSITIPPPTQEETSVLPQTLSHLATLMFDTLALERAACHWRFEESAWGMIVYDSKLHLQKANEKARDLLGLDIKLDDNGNLEVLEPWIVTLLKRGLRNEIHSHIGHIDNPMEGGRIRLFIETRPLISNAQQIGAIALVQKDG